MKGFASVCGGAALIKVCLAIEHGTLPANLHYNEPNPNNASLVSGILQVSARQPADLQLSVAMELLP